MLDIARVRVRSFSVDYLDIHWDIAPTFEDVLDYNFVVQRSAQQYVGYVDISPEIINLYQFRDITVRGQHARYRTFWYRLKVTKRTDATAPAVFPAQGGVRLEAELDLYGLEFARQENLRLQEFAGREVLVFPKLVFGQHCPNCVDRVERRKVRSGCLACFDTGWTGGYGQPVRCYMEITTPPKLSQNSPQGKLEIAATQFKLGNYPVVNEGDLVVEGENKRWIIGDPVVGVTKARAMFRQQGSVFEADRGDVVYKLPINLTDAEISSLLPTPERNYTNPSTFADSELDKAISAAFGGRMQPK